MLSGGMAYDGISIAWLREETPMTVERRAPVAERPGTKGYGISAASDGLMGWDWAVEQIAASRNYWICSTRADGRPHAMPVWGVWVGDALIFSTGGTSVRGRNIAARPAIVVHLESGDDAVVLEGVAERATDAELLTRFVEAYDAKYKFRPDTNDAGSPVYALRPMVAFGWLEKDYPKTATRWVWE
jgi:hypothetical protein